MNLRDDEDCRYCSVTSQAAGEDPIGTAIAADQWLFIEDKDRLLKAIAGIKDSSVNAIANEAIDHWLAEAEQQEIIQKFNLDQLEELG
ncbi:MAG: hypothetical protein ACFCVD_08200 [Nodosilinea sp.]